MIFFCVLKPLSVASFRLLVLRSFLRSVFYPTHSSHIQIGHDVTLAPVPALIFAVCLLVFFLQELP